MNLTNTMLFALVWLVIGAGLGAIAAARWARARLRQLEADVAAARTACRHWRWMWKQSLREARRPAVDSSSGMLAPPADPADWWKRQEGEDGRGEIGDE